MGIGAAFGGAVQVAATFEKAMSGVKAVMAPADVVQFGAALEDLAISLGAKTSFNALETAGAIEELIKQGIPAEAVLGGAADAVLALAAATGTAPAAAATVAAQAMNAFKVSVADLPEVVDRLAGVTNVTAADMGGLRLALQQVGAVAHLAGFSFEDTVTAIGAMANAGVVGSDAGTSLKTMFLNLIPSTKAQVTAFKNLGIITADGANQFFDATGRVKNMAGVAGVLETALAGMSHEQKLATAQTLFGTDAMRAAAILAELGAQGFSDLAGQVQKVSAADQAAERLNNLLGKMEQLGGAIQSLQIKIGNLFLPALGAITVTVQGVVQSFLKLSPAAQVMLTSIVGITGVLAGLVGGFVLLVPLVRLLGPSFLAIGRILLSLVPVFRAVALVAGILVAAWTTNLFGIREKVQAAFDAIPGILEAVSGAFRAAGDFWATTIVPTIQLIANAVERRILPVFNNLVDRIGPLLSHFGVLMKKAFSGDIGGAVDSFILTIGTLFPAVRGPLIAIRTAIGNFAEVAGPVLGILGQVFERVFAGNISGALSLFRDLMVDLIPVIGPVLDILGSMAAFVGPRLSAAFQAVVRVVQNELLPRFGALAAFVLPLLQTAAAKVTAFWNDTFLPTLSRLGSFLQTDVAPKIAAFVDGVLPTLQTGAEAVRVFWDTQLAPAFGKLGAFLETEVTPKIQAFVTSVMPLLNEGAQAIITFWETRLLPTLQNPGPTLEALAGSFESAVGRIGTAAETGKLGAGAEALTTFFANFDTIKGQVESLAPLFASIGNFAQSIINLNLAIGALAARSAGPIFDAIAQGIRNFSDAVAPTVGPIGAVGEGLGKIGTFLQPATEFFNNLAGAVERFNKAINEVPNIQTLLAGSGELGPGQAGPVAPGTPSSFDAAGAVLSAAAGGGPLITIGQLLISNQAEAEAFLQRMTNAIRGSAGRVNAPPDNSANPALMVAQ